MSKLPFLPKPRKDSDPVLSESDYDQWVEPFRYFKRDLCGPHWGLPEIDEDDQELAQAFEAGWLANGQATARFSGGKGLDLACRPDDLNPGDTWTGTLIACGTKVVMPERVTKTLRGESISLRMTLVQVPEWVKDRENIAQEIASALNKAWGLPKITHDTIPMDFEQEAESAA